MLGPIVCHTIRPVVFKSGLWSIEVEKSWTHLFEIVTLLMKRAYDHEQVSHSEGASSNRISRSGNEHFVNIFLLSL